jgi:hypothetical protein
MGLRLGAEDYRFHPRCSWHCRGLPSSSDVRFWHKAGIKSALPAGILCPYYETILPGPWGAVMSGRELLGALRSALALPITVGSTIARANEPSIAVGERLLALRGVK